MAPARRARPISEAAVPLQLDTYMFFDKTGSMQGSGSDCLVGGTGAAPSCAQKNGAYDFLNSSEATGMRVAAAMWADENSCTPIAGPTVTFGALPAPLPNIKTMLDGATPSGISNIGVLFDTLIADTTSAQTAGRTMVGIVLADGAFAGCTETLVQLATRLSDHRAATGIETYMLGMSGSFNDADVEALAVAGGAEPHANHCGHVDPAVQHVQRDRLPDGERHRKPPSRHQASRGEVPLRVPERSERGIPRGHVLDGRRTTAAREGRQRGCVFRNTSLLLQQ